MVNSTDSRFVEALVPSAPDSQAFVASLAAYHHFHVAEGSVVACVSQGLAQSSDVGWRGAATSTDDALHRFAARARPI